MVDHDVDRKPGDQMRKRLPVRGLKLKKAHTPTKRRYALSVELQHIKLLVEIMHGLLVVEVKTNAAYATIVQPLQFIVSCKAAYYSNAVRVMRIKLLYERH